MRAGSQPRPLPTAIPASTQSENPPHPPRGRETSQQNNPSPRPRLPLLRRPPPLFPTHGRQGPPENPKSEVRTPSRLLPAPCAMSPPASAGWAGCSGLSRLGAGTSRASSSLLVGAMHASTESEHRLRPLRQGGPPHHRLEFFSRRWWPWCVAACRLSLPPHMSLPTPAMNPVIRIPGRALLHLLHALH